MPRGLALLALASLLAVGPAQADPDARPGFDYGPEPSAGHVHEVLSQLVQWQRSPFAHGDAARDYLLARYAAMGVDAEARPQGHVWNAGLTASCENVVATVPGRDSDRLLVVMGHYDAVLANGDGVGNTAQGAYDNGVGTAAVFELARLFHQFHAGRTDASLAFVHSDCEEYGEVGAKGFVDALTAGVQVVGAVNLDMVGLNYPVADSLPPAPQPYYNLYAYTSPVEDRSAFAGNDNVSASAARFAALRATTERVAYEQLGLPAKYVWVLDDVEGNSDQRPFTEAGIPAVWLRGMHHGLLFNRGSSSPEDVRKGLDEMNYKHTPLDTLATLEAYAGGKAELLRGIRAPLDVAYRLALALAGGDAAAEDGLALRQAERAAPGADALLLGALALAALTCRSRR
jgi:hypothetical protein